MDRQNYIFGYGSLIEQESRMRTTPSAKIALPVRVRGVKRGWFAQGSNIGFSTTFLGCILEENFYTNGVIYKVSEEELSILDVRESNYHRTKISFTDVEDLSGSMKESSNIWIYTNNFVDNQVPDFMLPSAKYPIVQSYVDICINGCLEIEALYPKAREGKFAIDFIVNTHYWSKYWVNDRIYPRRPFIHRPNAYSIDRLLKEHLVNKDLFNQIVIE